CILFDASPGEPVRGPPSFKRIQQNRKDLVMITRLLISSSFVLGGAMAASAQDAMQDRDDDRIQGEVQIRTDDAQQAGDRQQDQARPQTELGQTGRDATGMQDHQDGQKMKSKDVKDVL